jgi:hypothetical protein
MIRRVYAYEKIPAGPGVFLAGPTPRTSQVRSWRPDAINLAGRLWCWPEPLNVLIPEPHDGRWSDDYDAQASWEQEALDGAIGTHDSRAAGAVAFWVPRDLSVLPGFTTNIEIGWYFNEDRWLRASGRPGRVVFGSPTDCPSPEKNRNAEWRAHRFGIPIRRTLPDTIRVALDMAAGTHNPTHNSLEGNPSPCP